MCFLYYKLSNVTKKVLCWWSSAVWLAAQPRFQALLRSACDSPGFVMCFFQCKLSNKIKRLKSYNRVCKSAVKMDRKHYVHENNINKKRGRVKIEVLRRRGSSLQSWLLLVCCWSSAGGPPLLVLGCWSFAAYPPLFGSLLSSPCPRAPRDTVGFRL